MFVCFVTLAAGVDRRGHVQWRGSSHERRKSVTTRLPISPEPLFHASHVGDLISMLLLLDLYTLNWRIQVDQLDTTLSTRLQ